MVCVIKNKKQKQNKNNKTQETTQKSSFQAPLLPHSPDDDNQIFDRFNSKLLLL